MGASETDADARDEGAVTSNPEPATVENAAAVPRRRRARPLPAVVGVLVLAALVGFGVLQGCLHGRAAPGVSAAGVSLSRAAPAQARDDLARLTTRRGLDTIVLQSGQGPLTLRLADLGLTIDLAATARRAARQGRLGLLGLGLWYGRGGAVAPVVRLDANTFQTGLQKIAPVFDKPPRDATLALVGDTVGVRASATGLTIDEAALKSDVLGALSRWRRFQGAAPLMASQPAVGTAAAQAASTQAAVYLSSPLRLRFRQHEIDLSPAQMASMLSVTRGATAADDPLTFDNPRARKVLLHLLFVETPAVNATVVVKGKKVFIRPSSEGFGLDMSRFVGHGLHGVAARSASGGRAPDDTRADGHDRPAHGARPERPGLAVHDLLRSDEQAEGPEHRTGVQAGRRHGHQERHGLLAERHARPADGEPRLRLRAGDRERCPAPGRGGWAVPVRHDAVQRRFFAGLPIVERHPHDFYIDHYPIGRDAQVAYGSQDLKFRNDTGHALLLRCWAGSGQVTVVLVGATGRTVTFTTSRFYGLTLLGTSRAHPRVITDDTLDRGVVVREDGFDGRTVKVVRTVRQGDQVLFRDSFVSTYAPKDWVKRIGTKG